MLKIKNNEEDLTDTILDFPIFEEECPISIDIVGDREQLVLNDMIGNWCAFCEDNYKKCWKKYFSELKKRKEIKNESNRFIK